MGLEKEPNIDKEVWVGAEKMERFGFSAAKYLLENGELDRKRYVKEFFSLEKNVDGDGYHLGELEIPAWLVEADFGEEIVAGCMGDYGLGHRRAMTPPLLLLEALGIPTKMVDIMEGNNEKRSLSEGVLIAFRERYSQVSHAEGYRNGVAHPAINFEQSKAPRLVNLILNVWQRIDQSGYHDFILGRPGNKKRVEKESKVAKELRKWLNNDMQKNLEGVSRSLIFHPLIGLLDLQGPALVWGTDVVVDPWGWDTPYPTIVETALAKERFVQELGAKAAEKVFYVNGFPAPLGGVSRSEQLSEIRADEINSPDGLPLTFVLTASGAATAQLKVMEETILTIAPMVAAGEMRLVVQAGHDHLGKIVENSMWELAELLEEMFPGFKENLIVHYSKSAQGAIDFGEVISSGVAPMVFGVKGGELTRMLLQLGIPQIVPVAIGDQEYWNVIVAAMQDTQIFLLPTVYEQCKHFIETFPSFPEEMKRSALLAIDRHRVENLEEGLQEAALAISEKRTKAETNRSVMVDVIEWLMSQERATTKQ